MTDPFHNGTKCMQSFKVAVRLVIGLLAAGLVVSVYAVEAPHETLAAPPHTAKGRDPAATSAEKSANGGDIKPSKLREGSKLIDQIGEFQRSGDQFSFFAKENYGGLRVLENLALERIARVLDDNPSMRLWSVTGVVTEYRNENYLLITRAVVKAQSKPKASAGSRKTEAANKKEE